MIKKWLGNISYTLWGKIIALIFYMLLDIVAARYLQVEIYAEWLFFFSILTMMFYFGWMGINTSVKVHISKCSASDRETCLKASIILRLLVSLVISIIILFTGPKVSYFLGYPEKYSNLKWLLSTSSALVFFNSFTEFYKEYFMGRDKFKELFMITSVEYIGYFLFATIGLRIINNIQAIAYGYLVAGISVSILGLSLLRKDNHSNGMASNKTIKEYMFSIFKYAIPIAIISIGGLILVELDTFMLGMLSTKESVATYGIAKNLTSKATHVNYALTVGVMTTFAVITENNYEERKNQFKKSLLINAFITAFVALSLTLFSNLAINVLYGKEYIMASRVIKYLVPYYALYAISNFYSSFLDFRNKAGIRSIGYSTVVVLDVILNYVSIPKYGALGAALATDFSLMPYAVMVFIFSKNEWRKMRETL